MGQLKAKGKAGDIRGTNVDDVGWVTWASIYRSRESYYDDLGYKLLEIARSGLSASIKVCRWARSSGSSHNLPELVLEVAEYVNSLNCISYYQTPRTGLMHVPQSA